MKDPVYMYIRCVGWVKCTLVQALRLCTRRTAHRRSRGIALLFLDLGIRRGESSASLPGRSLPPGKNRYPFYRRLGGPQGPCGQVRKISSPPGFDPRTVQPVASRYTDWATGPTIFDMQRLQIILLQFNVWQFSLTSSRKCEQMWNAWDAWIVHSSHDYKNNYL